MSERSLNRRQQSALKRYVNKKSDLELDFMIDLIMDRMPHDDIDGYDDVFEALEEGVDNPELLLKSRINALTALEQARERRAIDEMKLIKKLKQELKKEHNERTKGRNTNVHKKTTRSKR